MKPIKLSELIEAVEMDFEELVTRVDLREGCLAIVDRAVLSAVEEGDEESLENLPDWQKQEVQVARAINDDSGERFVAAPDKFDFHEYRHMEHFIGTVSNPDAAEQLSRAIKGKGAFRHFKDTAHRFELLQDWYRFRDAALKEFVIAWAETNTVPFEDDLAKRK